MSKKGNFSWFCHSLFFKTNSFFGHNIGQESDVHHHYQMVEIQYFQLAVIDNMMWNCKFVKLCHEPPTWPKITNKQSFILQKNAKVNLDFAARVIHGVTLPEAVMKTRIRRLYDIANILQSLQLIQKVQVTESNGVKKPAFQYIGPDVDSMGKFSF